TVPQTGSPITGPVLEQRVTEAASPA
ncbi:uncharacterized protein METZ01_LOCUS485714, partial [marine metagenome]